jgi:flagellar hook protein FlgE
MGLASALSTALTGLTAAESTIDVVGNNVANSNTVGFKASDAVFATQFLQTQGLGSAPTGNSGGTNPRQVGLGVLTAEITPDFTQGTIEISANPSDLAIQGDGFFIVQASTGEQLFTRNGIFKTNSENQLVTTTGQRLLGYGVDERFQVEATTLRPIEIPLGSSAVAQPTQNVFFSGTLTPSGDLATTAEIIQTGILGDAAFTRPATKPDAAAGAAGNLSGKYRYYVTYATISGGPGNGTESRPAPLSDPINAANQQIDLTNVPTANPAEWGPTAVRRIYRNLENDDSTFYYLGEIADNVTTTFTDNVLDSAISGNDRIDLDGPKINENTLLNNVLLRDGDQYVSLFADGTLTFAGRKGGRTLADSEFTVDGSTTVLDLLNFMEDAMGIQTPPGSDPLNPIPQSETASGVGINPGGSVTADGRIKLVGNNGVENAIDIGLGGLQLTTASGTENINLSFGSAQAAVGESAVSDFIVYDSLGIPLNVRVTAVLQERTNTSTTYRWFADSPDNDPASGSQIAVGSGLIRFDGEGKLTAVTDSTVSIERRNVASESPLEFELDFSQLSGLAADNATLSASRQDGSPPGTLSSYIIGEDGRVRGVFSNGVTRDLAQIRLVRFANPAGLEQRGQNLFAAGVNSGLPIEGDPNQQGIGQIIAGAVELSNTDIGKNLIDLILASTAYRGNTRVIDASQRLLEELLNLRR